MTILRFRLFVILTFIMLSFSISVDFIWKNDLVKFVSEFSISLLDAGTLSNNLFVTLFVLMLFSAGISFIGLLRLQHAARYAFIAVFIFMIPIYFLLGISVQSGVSRIFYDMGLLMSGSLLVIIFTKPVKGFFK